MVTAMAGQGGGTDRLRLGFPRSGMGWLSLLLALFALVVGIAFDADSVSRLIPGVPAVAALLLAMRAGIVRDERSAIMWLFGVLAGLYALLLLLAG